MKKTIKKCSVLLGNPTEKVYRLLDVRLSIFSKNTPNESTTYKYNTLVDIERSDIRNER